MIDSQEAFHLIPPAVLAALDEVLRTRGWFVSQELVPPSLCQDLLKQLRSNQEAGLFKKAAIGQGPRQQILSEVRSDHIKWIEDSAPTALEAPFIAWLKAFKEHLCSQLYLGVTEQELHYACYPPGGGYQKHLDVFQSESRRVISFVLYLNEAWKEGDGGELSLFSEDDPNHLEIKIPPVFSQLAVFLSGNIYHQVEFTNQERISVTGWLKKPAPTAVLPVF